MKPEARPTTLAAYELAAESRLDPGALGYYAGGAGDEVTLRDNHAAWNRLSVVPRTLVGVGSRDPSVTVLGKQRPHPLIVAPMAFQRLADPEGEIATARGAAAADTLMCLSTLSTTSPAQVATAVPEGERWFQLYVFSDRGVTRDLVAQAHENGYEALVVTVDLPVMGIRDRDRSTGVHSAPAEMVSSAKAAGAQGQMTPTDFANLFDPDLKWSDIEEFAAQSPLPVLVKGILTAHDADLAAEHGAAGVIVSNHGGRQLDTTLSGADALGPIVEAVGDRLEVLVDGGIRRGVDVLKALALGARAVMIGRPVLWGLATAGADGVEHVLKIVLEEFDIALALAGAPCASELSPEFIAPARW
jgi:4-hydroxymandelate oxidase